MTSLKPTINACDAYSLVMDELTKAARSARAHGIAVEEFVPALLDFASALAFAVAGQEGAKRFLIRLRSGLIAEARNNGSRDGCEHSTENLSRHRKPHPAAPVTTECGEPAAFTEGSAYQTGPTPTIEGTFTLGAEVVARVGRIGMDDEPWLGGRPVLASG